MATKRKSGPDRRTECRYSADGECTVRYKIRHNLIETPAWLSDLSMHGFRLAAAQPIPDGTVVMVTIDSASENPLYGQVVHGIASPVSGNYCGVKIIDGTIPYTVFGKLIREAVVTPEETHTPACFTRLGLPFPSTREEVHAAFRHLSMKAHPDHGGTEKDFIALYSAYQEAMKLCS